MRYAVITIAALWALAAVPAAGQPSDRICSTSTATGDIAKRVYVYCLIEKLPDTRFARSFAYHLISKLPKSIGAGEDLNTQIDVIHRFLNAPADVGADSLATLTELKAMIYPLISETGDLSDAVAAGMPLSTFSLTSGISAGLRSQGDVWSHLAAFLVERAEEEAATAFVNKLRDELVGTELGALVESLLPQTYVLLKTRQNVTIAEMGPLWQTAFREDLRRIPVRILDEDDNYRTVRLLLARSLGRDANSAEVLQVLGRARMYLGAGRLINDAATALQTGTDPMRVLSNLPQYADPFFSALAESNHDPNALRQIRTGVDFFSELTEDLYFQGAHSTDSLRGLPPYFLTARNVARAPEEQLKLYLFLLALDNSSERLRAAVQDSRKYFAIYSLYTHDLLAEAEEVQAQLSEARGAGSDPSRATRYQLYLESALDVASSALLFLDVSKLDDRASATGLSLEHRAELTSWLTTSERSGVESIRNQLQKGLKAADHLVELQKAIAARSYPAMWQQASAFYYVATEQTVPTRIAQAMTFAVNVAVAETGADVSHAVRATADPVGGYKTKREDKSTISVTGYFGGGAGVEGLQSALLDDTNPGFVAGVHAPLGVEYVWGNGKSSNGIMLSVLDFGSLIQYRASGNEPNLVNDGGSTPRADVEKLPEIGFRQVFSPGLFFVHGFAGSPVTFGLGVQANPDLRSMETSGEPTDVSVVRGSIFFALDLTLFRL